MRIALVGAPGAGKSDLALALADELLVDGDTAIIDNYVSRLSDVTDIELGHFASYTSNIQIAMERLKGEQHAEAIKPPVDHIITCGTVIETILYTQMHARAALKIITDRDEQFIEVTRAETTARLYSQLIWDHWRYDHVFVLPLQDPEEGRWNTDLDNDLIGGLEAFFLPYDVLQSEDAESRATEAFARIELAKVNQSDPSEN